MCWFFRSIRPTISLEMPVPSQGHCVFTVFQLLTDFVCLYTYEFLLSLCKIVRSSVILLLPLSPPSPPEMHCLFYLIFIILVKTHNFTHSSRSFHLISQIFVIISSYCTDLFWIIIYITKILGKTYFIEAKIVLF